MNLPGKMKGAPAMDRIPSGRIGLADILGFKPDTLDCIIDRKTPDTLRGLPGGTARGAPDYLDTGEDTPGGFDPKLRYSEQLSIDPQADLPGKTASGRRSGHPFYPVPPARGYHRDTAQRTDSAQIRGNIRVCHEVEHKIRLNALREVTGRIVDDDRQRIVDGYYFKIDEPRGMRLYGRNLLEPAAVPLENH